MLEVNEANKSSSSNVANKIGRSKHAGSNSELMKIRMNRNGRSCAEKYQTHGLMLRSSQQTIILKFNHRHVHVLSFLFLSEAKINHRQGHVLS